MCVLWLILGILDSLFCLKCMFTYPLGNFATQIHFDVYGFYLNEWFLTFVQQVA